MDIAIERVPRFRYDDCFSGGPGQLRLRCAGGIEKREDSGGERMRSCPHAHCIAVFILSNSSAVRKIKHSNLSQRASGGVGSLRDETHWIM